MTVCSCNMGILKNLEIDTIIIICRNRHSYLRSWMPHKRETQMVCNLHFPTGTTYFRIFLNLEWKGISEENTLPVSWLDEKLSLLFPRPGREPTTSRTPRLHSKQGVPRPTRSAIGRRFFLSLEMYIIILDKILYQKKSFSNTKDRNKNYVC